MATMKTTSVLAKFFNEGEGKVAPRKFLEELKALSAEEKTELATLAAVELGVELVA